MSRMEDCIDTAVKADGLDPRRAEEAKKQLRKLRDQYRAMPGVPQHVADARASADFAKAMADGVVERRHKVLNQLRVMRDVHARIFSSSRPDEAVMGFVRFAEGKGYTGKSAEKLIAAWEQKINDRMQEVLREVGLDVLGNSRNPKLLTNIILEKNGQNSGDEVARKLARVIEETEDMLVRAFNQRGGNIAILKNRGMSQSHDPIALKAAGPAAWKNFITPLIAWDRITDHYTGQPFAVAGGLPDPVSADRFLDDIYQGIQTHGWDDRDPTMSTGGKALYNRRAEHRVLHFKNGDAQLAYNREFGTGDPFTSMINGLHGLARDVALMDVLGPNPLAMLEFAAQSAQKRAADLVTMGQASPKLIDKAARAGARAKGTLAELSGAASIPHHHAVARFFGGIRAFKVATDLGSALLSSVTDAGTMTAAAHAIGMNASNVLSRHIKLMASGATRETAARMGYVAETLADAGAGYSRFMGKTVSGGLMQRMSSFTLRATGLNFKTDMAKISFRMSFAGELAENGARTFDQLDAPLRKAMVARGISAADWDALRHASGRFTADNGADFISPLYWAKTQTVLPVDQADDLASRVQMMIEEHVEYAVPTASAEARAMMKFGLKSGTIPGELMNSAMMYKSFGVSLMLGQYRRFMAIEGNWNRAWYAAKVGTMLMVLGALSIQLKELAKGNDPRPMNTLKFWIAANFQGGGLGIFGDFFQAEMNRFGGGIAETIAGPVASLFDDVAKPLLGNVGALVAGKNTHFTRDIVDSVGRNTPFLSSAIGFSVAYDRLRTEILLPVIDPEAELTLRRKIKKREKDYGTGSYLPHPVLPGDGFRLPDLSNAFGGSKP